MRQECRWINEPKQWSNNAGSIQVVTEDTTDFWSHTWYGFNRFSGHVYGWDVTEDFTLQVRVRGDFTTLYDQAGVMITADESHWLKAGIEFNDGQPMIGSVLTDTNSDWATGLFFWRSARFLDAYYSDQRLPAGAVFYRWCGLAVTAPVLVPDHEKCSRGADVLHPAARRVIGRIQRYTAWRGVKKRAA